jgi:hypothetical protein
VTTAAEKKADAADAKADKAARKKETPDQTWEREQRDRADERREAADKETIRRAGLTPELLRADDAKKGAENEKERLRWERMTTAERNDELAKTEPVPPWQTRLPGGKIFDARAQRPLVLFATDGSSLDSGDAAAAMEFYLEYVTSAAEAQAQA